MRGRRAPDERARWALAELPRAVLVVILVVEVAAAAAVAASLRDGVAALPPGWGWTLLVLVVAGVASTEASLGVERVRRQSDEAPHIDLSSVWAFAGAVLLPGWLASAVVVVIYGHTYARVWRRSGVPPHRVLFSVATVVLAVQAAAAITAHGADPDPFRSTAGLVTVVLALLAYAAVNMVLVVSVIVLSGPHRDLATFLHVLGHGDDAVLEFATLSMGALVAGAMASFGPAYAVLVLPPLVVLHRTVLVRQLEEAASTDGKTGLLNAAAWHVQATRALRRTARSGGRATVLLLDLDHFKNVNDSYGHLVGDVVLAAVAEAVRAEVRDDDLVGRFGGEEFVVLLPGFHGDGRQRPEAVAERIRSRIAGLRVDVGSGPERTVVSGLTASIGGATLPTDGAELATLLDVADSAMYAAKHAGRNAVRIGLPQPGGAHPGPVPGPHA